MKKFLFLPLFTAILFLITIFSPTESLAGCDPNLFNSSNTYTVDPNSTQIGAKKSCNAGDCENTKTPSLIVCWRKGATVKQPECQPGYQVVTHWGCDDYINGRCCKAGVIGNTCDKVENIGSCADNYKNVTFTSKNFCGNTQEFIYKNGTCVSNPTFTDPDKLAQATCDGVNGVETAIGCVPTGDLPKFLSFILKFAFAISGGVILLMVILTGYTLITSSGNPEKLQAVKENIVSLFSGIILIAFSLILLQTVGADVLKFKSF